MAEKVARVRCGACGREMDVDYDEQSGTAARPPQHTPLNGDETFPCSSEDNEILDIRDAG